MIQFFKDRWNETTIAERCIYAAILVLGVILYVLNVSVLLAVLWASAGIVFLVLIGILSSTTNGLKKEFLLFFIAMAWACAIRTAQWMFDHFLPREVVSLLVVVPVLVTGIHVVIYLYGRQKEKQQMHRTEA